MTVHVPEPTVVAAAELAPVRTTCPYCGVGCGVLATPDGLGGVSIAGDPDHPVEFRSAVLERRGARRDGRARAPAAPPDDRGTARVVGRRADGRGGRLRPHRRGARPGCGRLLSVGPAPDGGLLRRQQAHERLLGLEPRRHQFALVHGLVGRRSPPRFRLRHRAGLLRRPRQRRSPRAGRLERGLVPPRPVPAHAGQWPDARRAHRR